MLCGFGELLGFDENSVGGGRWEVAFVGVVTSVVAVRARLSGAIVDL